MTTAIPRVRCVVLCALLSLLIVEGRASGIATTKTTLNVTSKGAPVTSVGSGTVISLTASVMSGTSAVTVGQVLLCDAKAQHCTGIHLLGTAQLTKAGKAVMKFVPGIGNHSYKAIYLGVPNGTSQYAGSISSIVPLSVTGAFITSTGIAKSGVVGNYTLKATVTGFVNAATVVAPTGTISFLDTTTNTALGTAQLGLGKAGLTFLNRSNLATGSLSWSAAVGDFNNDGHLDVAIANYGDGTVSILLGKGDGTFTPAPNSPISVTFDPESLVVGDFNGDGKLDLAMENSYYDGVVTILLGNGDGTFTQAPNSPITVGGPFETPGAVAVGDFNGDGILDIVATNSNNVSIDPGTMTLLLGKGDGTFAKTPSSPISVGSVPISIAVGDFNEDGIPDLAMSNFAGNNVTVLLGKGDGTFTQSANSPIAVGSFPTSIVSGDFNGDGILDLAVTNSQYTTSSVGSLTILLGKGDGTFGQAANSPITVGGDPWSVVVGDFNGDGRADLAVVNNADGTLTVLKGNGNGKFTRLSKPMGVGTFPQSGAIGDFNGDGISDLAVANSGSNTCTILLPQPTAASTASVTGISPGGAGTHRVDASYGGDSSYLGSTSRTITLTGTAATIRNSTTIHDSRVCRP